MLATTKVIETRARWIVGSHPRDPYLAEIFGAGQESASGEVVNAETALGQDAFLSGVRYIAETMAALPLFVMQTMQPRGKRRAMEQPLYDRLHAQPNPWQTTFEWRDMLFHHVILRGNAFGELVPADDGGAPYVVPLHPDRVTPFWVAEIMPESPRRNERAYEYQPPNGRRRVIFQDEMFHLTFMPDDGLRGRSVIEYAAETIGAGLAARNYGARFFGNNARPGLVLKHPKTLSKQAVRRLLEEWDQNFRATKQWKTALLQEGLEVEKVGLTNEDAQFLEHLEFDREAMAIILRIPPHKVGALRRATFSNIEQQSIDAVIDTVLPWAVRFEQAANRDLLTRVERQRGFFIKLLIDGLMRGDFESRHKGYAIGRQWGYYSANDVLELEDRNPIEGGDVYLVPLNMVPADQVGRMMTAGAERALAELRLLPEASEARSLASLVRLKAAHAPTFEDAARRLLKREADTVERQFRRQVQERSLADFLVWLTQFYTDFEATAARALTPALESYAAAVSTEAAGIVDPAAEAPAMENFVASYAEAYAARHARESQQALEAIVADAPPQEAAERLATTLEAWRTERPGHVARAETSQAVNAFARFVWLKVGVRKLRWVTFDPCPLCAPLGGRIVGIEREFVQAGEKVTGKGRPTLSAGKTFHPPLHNGCDCMVLPA